MKTVTVQDHSAFSSFDVHTFGSGRPVFAFVGGVHGNETAGINAAELLVKYFERHNPVRGTVRVIPTVNPSAMRVNCRCSPVDGVDLNRCFPGNPGGSLTYRIADALWQETANADFVIDLHGCDGGSLPYLLTICDEFPAVRRLAEAIPMGIAVRSKGTGGQLFVEACRRRGQAALVIELPCVNAAGKGRDDAAEQCFKALLELLRSYGVTGGTPSGTPSGTPLVFYGCLKRAALPKGSAFEPCAVRGTIAERGRVIGWADGVSVRMPERGFILNLDGRCVYAAVEQNAMKSGGAGKDIAGACNTEPF